MQAAIADGKTPGWVIDLLLGTTVALAIALIIATGQGGEQPPDLLAYLFAAGFGGLMLLRRRAPRVVLAASVLGVFGYYTLGYPPIGVAVPVVAALFAAADAGLTRWAAGAGAVVLVVSTAFRIGEGEPLGYLLGLEAVTNGALIVTAIALGDSLRTRRARTRQQVEIRRLTELQLTREADRRLQAQREGMARDLHDAAGHTLSVISLHAGVAAEAIGRDDAAAREAVERIRFAASQTLQDLRSMVRLLRAPATDGATDGAGRTLVSLAGVSALVDSAHAAGLTVRSRIAVQPSQLSPSIDAAAFRVVQESLTNVLRHAHATQAKVTAELHGGDLRVIVSDDGVNPVSPSHPAGHGLAGMAERVRLLGGSLHTRPGEGGGFVVDVRLPAKLEA